MGRFSNLYGLPYPLTHYYFEKKIAQALLASGLAVRTASEFEIDEKEVFLRFLHFRRRPHQCKNDETDETNDEGKDNPHRYHCTPLPDIGDTNHPLGPLGSGSVNTSTPAVVIESPLRHIG